MKDTKRSYDRAAEAWHSHTLSCSVCTLHGAERCEDGERLLQAENDAWTDYRSRRS